MLAQETAIDTMKGELGISIGLKTCGLKIL